MAHLIQQPTGHPTNMHCAYLSSLAIRSGSSSVPFPHLPHSLSQTLDLATTGIQRTHSPSLRWQQGVRCLNTARTRHRLPCAFVGLWPAWLVDCPISHYLVRWLVFQVSIWGSFTPSQFPMLVNWRKIWLISLLLLAATWSVGTWWIPRCQGVADEPTAREVCLFGS